MPERSDFARHQDRSLPGDADRRGATRRTLLAAAAIGGAFTFTGPAAAQDAARPDLVVAVDGLYRTLEPIDGNSTNGSRMHPNIYDPLVGRNWLEDPEGTELAPGLATDWEQTSPTVWTIALRDDVTFHNGAPMTAEDVAFSLSAERIWGEDALVPAGTRYTEGFVRVEATGPLTVEIETEAPDPNLMYRFITPLGYIVPKAAYLEMGFEAFGQAPIGTGPYAVTAFDPSDRVVMEANDDYWGGTPPAASVTFQIVPEFSARLAGTVAGQYHIMVNVPADQLSTIARYDELRLETMGFDNYVMLAFNTLDIEGDGSNPLLDANLRYAMVSAIDRDALVEALWGEATFAPAPFNFPEFGAYYDESIAPRFPYDPDAAAAFLEAADYDGSEVVVNVTRGAFPNFDLAVEYLGEQWRNLGVDVRLNIVDSWALALQHPYGLLNMSMTTQFDGTPTRAIWGFWGPDSARATRERDRSWTPPDAFLEAGRAYLAATEFEEKNAQFRAMVDAWEEVTPALILWRNIASWVVRAELDWTPIASVQMNLGPGFLSIE